MPHLTVAAAVAVATGGTIAAAAESHTSISSAILAAAALVGALTALWKFLHLGELLRDTRRLAKLAQLQESFLEDWNGAPARPGQDARPGSMQRIATVEKRTEDINHLFRGEVTSRLTLIAENVEQLKAKGDMNGQALNRLEGRVDSVDKRISDHRRRNEEQIEHLRSEVERRMHDAAQRQQGDHARAETYRAALQEMGFDVQPPQPAPPTTFGPQEP